ncbi:hypothetical protein [Chroococcidiopsis sp. SAG 2025]|nr:hypothetical protein [Chroococcidiopsis sp. SAG 2025]
MRTIRVRFGFGLVTRALPPGEPLLASCRRPDDNTLYGENVATAA